MVGISITELFEMDLFQFVCYIDGYNKKLIQDQINDIISAVRIGMYTGQYWTGKRAPDANNLISKLNAELNKDSFKQEKEDDDIKKIEELKKNLELFK